MATIVGTAIAVAVASTTMNTTTTTTTAATNITYADSMDTVPIPDSPNNFGAVDPTTYPASYPAKSTNTKNT